MRFIDIQGILGKARRYVSGSTVIDPGQVSDPGKLADIIRNLNSRITDLEARIPPEATEFEVDMLDGGQVSLQHLYHGPIRYYVVHWTNTSNGIGPSALVAPAVVVNTATTSDMLVLDCFSDGKAVIRIEPSQYGVGVTT